MRSINIADIVRDRAWNMPESPALVEGSTTIDWAGLHARIAALAGRLRRHGVSAGDLVLLAMRTNVTHIAAALALSQIGAVFCGIDWRTRPGERNALISTLQPKLTLTDHATVAIDGCLVVQEDWFHEPPDADAEQIAVDASALSSLILSSGTTDKPKAVMLTHEVQMWRMVMRARDDGLRPGTRVLNSLPLWTSAGLSGLLAQLFAGSTTYFLPLLHSPAELVSMLEQRRIQQVTLVPTMVRSLLDISTESALLLPHLESLISLGSVFHAHEKRAALKRLTPHIHENYGSVTTGSIARATPRDTLAAPMSVGRPGTFVRIDAVDDNGRALPRGTVGRLRVSSPGNATGFWRSVPDEESERHFADGFVYPGDIGRIDATGRLFLEGRDSTTIIRGGNNIQPEEIEQVLMRHPGVAEAAVLGISEERLGEVPVALIVVRRDLTIADLAGHCRALLVVHKVPVEFRFVESLPTNAGGKLARAMLPDAWARAR